MHTCGYCEEKIDWLGLCYRCRIIQQHSLILAKEVAQLVRKGGVQLYIGIERTGQKNELVSVKRWSPLEPLESVESAEGSLVTSQSRQE